MNLKKMLRKIKRQLNDILFLCDPALMTFERKHIFDVGQCSPRNTPYELARNAARARKRNIKYEEKIASHPLAAYVYAKDVIQGPWPAGELAIMSHEIYACDYVEYILRGRWPAFEEKMKTNKHYGNMIIPYVTRLQLESNQDLMEMVLIWPQSSVTYANEIIKSRWPEAERIIAKSPDAIRQYMGLLKRLPLK